MKEGQRQKNRKVARKYSQVRTAADKKMSEGSETAGVRVRKQGRRLFIMR